MTRQEKFMPNGIPKFVRCYDNGGLDADKGTFDRFTVVFTGRYRRRKPDGQFDCWFQHVGMSEFPFSSNGFGQHGEHQTQIDVNRHGFAPAIGRKNHLGKRIPFDQLPPDCQQLVIDDYRDIWDLNGKAVEAA